MKKLFCLSIFLIVIILLFSYGCVKISVEKDTVQSYWDKTYGGIRYDYAHSLIQTSDGGYAVAGATSSKGAGAFDLWVIKLDSPGNMVWDRTYGGRRSEEAHSLIQTTDGGYAVAGHTSSKGAGLDDFWVIKLDKQGNLK